MRSVSTRLFLVALSLASPLPIRADVLLNEALVSNALSGADEDGDSSDWIELHNPEDAAVDLAGLFLSDDPGVPRKWPLPDRRLDPGAFLRVWCSGKNRAASLHTNFRLAGGEPVVLSDAGGAIVDVLVPPAPQTADHSWGRSPDGSDDLAYFARPTPGAPNDTLASDEWLSDRPSFDPPPGTHAAPVDVTITARMPFAGFEIRLTRDGSDPGPTSELWTAPIRLSESAVLRAAGFIDGARVTRPVAATYLLDAPAITLPPLSISIERADFELIHLTTTGHGREFERPAHLEIFREGVAGRFVPAVELGFGMRLHGGGGRSGGLETKKAYRAHFRDEYGAGKLRHALFPDFGVTNFDRIVLRAGFNDAFRAAGRATLIRDELVRGLHTAAGGVAPRGTFFNLFINTEHRGIYNVTERIDRAFFASRFPGELEGWDIVRNGGSDVMWELVDGDEGAWLKLLALIAEGVFREPDDYARAGEAIDLRDFARYMLVHIWAQNLDWPFNNWYAARPRREGARWIFLSWDAEVVMDPDPNPFQEDSLRNTLDFAATVPLAGALAALLTNEDFQRLFIEEFDRLARGPFADESVSLRIAELAARLEPDIPAELDAALGTPRPPAGPTVDSWIDAVDDLQRFVRDRASEVRGFIVRSPAVTLTRVTRSSPATVEPRGEVEVSLRGVALTEATRVLFAGVESPQVLLESPQRIRAVLPYDIAIDGAPAITTVDPSRGQFTSYGLLDVRFPRPEPVSIEPAVGSPGEIVVIRGSGFLDGARVVFGEVDAPAVNVASETELEAVVPGLGRGEVEVRVLNTRPGTLPALETLRFLIASDPGFLRADANGDFAVSITDAIAILDHLFRGRTRPCESALDADDSGRVNITDAVWTLDYAFRGGPPPPAPFPDCGEDPTPDGLVCESAGCR